MHDVSLIETKMVFWCWFITMPEFYWIMKSVPQDLQKTTKKGKIKTYKKLWKNLFTTR